MLEATRGKFATHLLVYNCISGGALEPQQTYVEDATKASHRQGTCLGCAPHPARFPSLPAGLEDGQIDRQAGQPASTIKKQLTRATKKQKSKEKGPQMIKGGKNNQWHLGRRCSRQEEQRRDRTRIKRGAQKKVNLQLYWGKILDNMHSSQCDKARIECTGVRMQKLRATEGMCSTGVSQLATQSVFAVIPPSNTLANKQQIGND